MSLVRLLTYRLGMSWKSQIYAYYVHLLASLFTLRPFPFAFHVYDISARLHLDSAVTSGSALVKVFVPSFSLWLDLDHAYKPSRTINNRLGHRTENERLTLGREVFMGGANDRVVLRRFGVGCLGQRSGKGVSGFNGDLSR